MGVVSSKQGGKGKKKKGNKHATNTNRRDRKKALNHRNKAEPGRCGSKYCTPLTGCKPWKTA
jgi:hypothetical protein